MSARVALPVVPPINQLYQCDNQSAEIDVSKIRMLSASTKQVIAALGAQLPPLFSDPAPLIQNVQTMDKIVQLLAESEESSTCRKAWGMFKTALSASLVAGGIGAITVGTPGCIGGGIVLLAGYVFLSCWLLADSLAEIHKIENNIPWDSRSGLGGCAAADNDEGLEYAGPILAVAGPGTIMPTYEAFSRTDRCEEVRRKRQEIMNQTLQDYQAQNQPLLPGIYNFYRGKYRDLVNDLSHAVKIARHSLEQMEQLPAKPNGADLRSRIHNLECAMRELAEAMSICQKFDPNPVTYHTAHCVSDSGLCTITANHPILNPLEVVAEYNRITALQIPVGSELEGPGSSESTLQPLESFNQNYVIRKTPLGELSTT